MDTNIHADTQTHRTHSCKKRKKEKEKRREITSAETKDCLGQLTQTGHSQTHFLEVKRTTSLSKHLPL